MYYVKRFCVFLLLIAVFLSCRENVEIKQKGKMYTKESILSYLDSVSLEKDFFFPNFNNEYYDYCGGSRMTLYGDEETWFIVFQYVIFNSIENDFEIIINYFGNNLVNLPWSEENGKRHFSNTIRVYLNNEDDLEHVYDDYPFVSLKVNSIKVRGKDIKTNYSLNQYKNKNVLPMNADNIDITSVLRYIVPMEEDVFKATDEELRTCLPLNVPRIMEIREWHHKPYFVDFDGRVKGVKPSQYETFNLVADVLVSKDTSKFKPTLEANTDWRNWKE